MSSGPYDNHSTWQWPKGPEPDLSFEAGGSLPGSFVHEEPNTEDEPTPQSSTEEPRQARTSHKHYLPRTCRICLEVVPPSYEPAPEGFASILSPNPSVSYISADPESGRLIRPCKCRGSSRYVHEGCLQAWRHADPSFGRRNYWECPTCRFRYRLERMRWGRWISSSILQVILTIIILFITVFVFGFVADPIINLYLDPYDTITSISSGGPATIYLEDEKASWAEHFLKGVASLGLLGFVKAFFAMSPWHWWNLRQSGAFGGGGRGRNATGRDRLENISWSLVIIGLVTFLFAVWKGVRAWSRKTLEKAGERVADVQGEDDDFEEQPGPDDTANSNPESRKTQ